MNEDFIQFEKSIKKKHSINWTPKYIEETRTNLSKATFVPIAIKVFEKLGWDIVFQDETTAEAKRKGHWDKWTEKITVLFEYGKVTVKSVSLGSEMWDNGRNSKRVKLFIYALAQTEKEFDRDDLIELEKEVEKTNYWDDYEIPESLPKPKKRRNPKLWIPIIGGIITSLILGYLIALLSVEGVYILLLFELGAAFAIGYALQLLIKLSDVTNYEKLHYIIIGMVILTFVSNQVFQYQIILNQGNFRPFSFWEFMSVRFENGLNLKDINTGWIGLVISWILQFVVTYFLGIVRMQGALTSYLLNKVPMEVIDFAVYHFVKEKTEDQVRVELSKMGWSDKQDQEQVFECIGSIQGAYEMQRM